MGTVETAKRGLLVTLANSLSLPLPFIGLGSCVVGGRYEPILCLLVKIFSACCLQLMVFFPNPVVACQLLPIKRFALVSLAKLPGKIADERNELPTQHIIDGSKRSLKRTSNPAFAQLFCEVAAVRVGLG